MAYAVSNTVSTIWGNKLVKILTVTSDAASGSVSTGLSVIEGIAMAPISCATAGFKLKINLSAASAAANGTVMVSSTTSGDAFQLIAIGR